MNRKRYVAFIDILGFKKIVINHQIDNSSLGEKLSEIYQSSILSSLTGENTTVEKNPRMEHFLDSVGIGVYQFSDSIVLYTKGDSDDDLIRIVVCLNRLFAQSMIRGFPLRGGLALKELYINGPIVVGNGLIDAADLEKAQLWSGLIIDKECLKGNLMEEKLLERGLIVREEVLIKCEDQAQSVKPSRYSHLVINWPRYLRQRGLISAKKIMKQYILYVGFPTKQIHRTMMKETVKFALRNLGSECLPSFIYDETGKVQNIKVNITSTDTQGNLG